MARSSAARWVVFLAAAWLLLACGGHAARTKGIRTALDFQDPKRALALLNKELEVESSEKLPEDTGGDNALLLLDRAMVLQAVGKWELSSRDLEVADKQIEILDLSRNAVDSIGKYMFSDDVGPYMAPAYEKLMINTMGMLTRLVTDDLNGARIEARRLAVMQKYLKDHEDPGASLNGPGSYIAGFVFEKSGKPQEAMRYYDEALQYGEYASLVEPIRRLAKRATYRTPRIRRVLGEEAPQSAPRPGGPGTPGPGPSPPGSSMKPSDPTGGSSASGEPAGDPSGDEATGTKEGTGEAESSATEDDGSESWVGSRDDHATEGAGAHRGAARFDDDANADVEPASSANDDGSEGAAGAPAPPERDDTGEILVVINFGRVPAKKARRIPIGLALTFASGYISPNNASRANRLAAQGLVTWVNFPELGKPRGQWGVPGYALNGNWQQIEGAIALDRAAKQAWDDSKGPIIAASITRLVTRLVAGEAVRRGSGGGILGTLLSLGTQATMTAADTPDTRSWATLPARIAFARSRVQPGTHWIDLEVRGVRKRQRVTVKPGGWAVVSMTVLS